MKNPSNPKERNLVKGAIRRVFSRSELRKEAIQKSIVDAPFNHGRPRVKTWCWCPVCKEHKAKSEMEVDHVSPVIRVTETLEEMSWDDVVNRIWCPPDNLVAVCKPCHKKKTKLEMKERNKYKKEKKKNG